MASHCAQDKIQHPFQGITRPYMTWTLAIPLLSLPNNGPNHTSFPALPWTFSACFCLRTYALVILSTWNIVLRCLHFWLFRVILVSAECHLLRLFWPPRRRSSHSLWYHPFLFVSFCFGLVRTLLTVWCFLACSRTCVWSVSRPWKAASWESRPSHVCSSLRTKLLPHRGGLVKYLH